MNPYTLTLNLALYTSDILQLGLGKHVRYCTSITLLVPNTMCCIVVTVEP